MSVPLTSVASAHEVLPPSPIVVASALPPSPRATPFTIAAGSLRSAPAAQASVSSITRLPAETTSGGKSR